MSTRFIMPLADVGSGIKPSSGAQLFFFEEDGVTPKDTFSDQLSTPTPNTNPVISDSNGLFDDIYISGLYRVTLKTSQDSQIFGNKLMGASDLVSVREQEHSATAGQTTFVVAGGYTVGKISAHLNGSKLSVSDYIAINGSDIVLNNGAALNDILASTAFEAFQVSNEGTAAFVNVGTAPGEISTNALIAPQIHGGQFMTYGGTADAITLTSVNTVALTALQTGDSFTALITTTNTGAATANIDGIGVVTCKTKTGADLPAGYFRIDVLTRLDYDGTDVIVSRAVEKDSNANGNFTKLEDGLLINIMSETVSVSANAFASVTLTFPEPFVDTNYTLSGGLESVLGTSPFVPYRQVNKVAASVDSWFAALDGVADTGSSDYCPTLTGYWY